jgi:hypothetical protein
MLLPLRAIVDDSRFNIDSHTDSSYARWTLSITRSFTRAPPPPKTVGFLYRDHSDKESTDPAFHLTTAPEGYRTATVTVNNGLYSGYSVWAYIRRMKRTRRGSLYIQSGLRVCLTCLEYEITLGANNSRSLRFRNSAQKH